MSSEIDGLKEWIAKIEREGSERHAENVERMAVLEDARIEQIKRIELMDGKVDMILNILSQAKGVVTLLKLIAWIIGLGSGLALIYGSIIKHGGH